MSTEYLREKINVLNNMIQADDLQSFQAELQIDAAKITTGDPGVDAAMAQNASNQRGVMLACRRRLDTYRERLVSLTDELETQGKASQ